MPWTRKQISTARAVEHGWKPTGSAKGFTQDFARKVNIETNYGQKKSMIRKKKASKA